MEKTQKNELASLSARQSFDSAARRAKTSPVKKFLGIALLGTTALTSLMVGLQKMPDITTMPLDDYMAKAGYASDYSRHFDDKNLRVWKSNSPLSPLHFIGVRARQHWDSSDKPYNNAFMQAAEATVQTLAGIPSSLRVTALNTQGIDAFAATIHHDTQDRESYINPPKDRNIARAWLQMATRKDFGALHFDHAEEDISRVVFEAIMLHEAHHPHQDKSLRLDTFNEADADRRAFEIIRERAEHSPALIDEAFRFFKAVRHVHTLNGDRVGMHATGLALERDYNSYDAITEDQTAYNLLHESLWQTLNDHFLPRGVSFESFNYHSAKAMLERDFFKDVPLGTEAAAAYVESIDLIQKITGGKYISEDFDRSIINLSAARESLPRCDIEGMPDDYCEEIKADYRRQGSQEDAAPPARTASHRAKAPAMKG